METGKETRTSKSIRLTLESMSHLREKASQAFALRNARITRLQSTLQLQVISLTGSIGLALYLGFALGISPLFTFTATLSVAVWVLRLKLKLIRVEKGKIAKEPPIEVGELIATIRKGQYQFYRVKKKSTFHFYLLPLKQKDVYEGLDFKSNDDLDGKNEKTLFLHKKRVFQNFYKVTTARELTDAQISA